MDPKKLGDIAGRLKSGGKGLGAGVGFIAAAGALAYGVSQSVYTGTLIDYMAHARCMFYYCIVY